MTTELKISDLPRRSEEIMMDKAAMVLATQSLPHNFYGSEARDMNFYNESYIL